MTFCSALVAGEVEYASKSAWLLNLISKPTIEKEPSRFNAVGAPSAKSMLSLAFNNRCDVIVATVVAGDEPVAQEQAVLEFLNGDLVLRWAEAVLELR